MRRTLVITSVLLASTFLAACGGSSSSSSGTSSNSSKSSGSGSSDSSSSGSSEIDKLVAKASKANVKVTYKSGGKSDEFTLIQHDGDSAFISGTSGIYTTGGKTVSCDGTGSDAQCVEMPGGENLAQSMTAGFFGVYSALFKASETNNAFVHIGKSTSNETIAGRDAKCVTIDAGVLGGGKGSATVCVDAETGILLRGNAFSGSNDSKDGIEATSYAESTADDVKPPAAPQALPGQ